MSYTVFLPVMFFICRQVVSGCGKSLPLRGMKLYELFVGAPIYSCKNFLF